MYSLTELKIDSNEVSKFGEVKYHSQPGGQSSTKSSMCSYRPYKPMHKNIKN